MPASSAADQTAIYIADIRGGIYTWDPDTGLSSMLFRAVGPRGGATRGIAACEPDSTLSSVSSADEMTFFVNREKEVGTLSTLTAMEANILARDADGGIIEDFTFLSPKYPIGGIELWPGTRSVLLAYTTTGLALLDFSSGNRTARYLSGVEIHTAPCYEGTGTTSSAYFYFVTGSSETGRLVKAQVTRSPLTFTITQTLSTSVPPNPVAIAKGDGLLYTFHSDGRGGTLVYSFEAVSGGSSGADDFALVGRIPLEVTDVSSPFRSSGTVPQYEVVGVSAVTRQYPRGGTVSDTKSVFFGAVAPGKTSGVSVVDLKVDGVSSISNVKLSIVKVDRRINVNEVFLVSHGPVIDHQTVPAGSFPGVNSSGSPTSPLNVPVGTRQNPSTGTTTESDYVSLAVRVPTRLLGGAQCKYQWFFDYEP